MLIWCYLATCRVKELGVENGNAVQQEDDDENDLACIQSSNVCIVNRAFVVNNLL